MKATPCLDKQPLRCNFLRKVVQQKHRILSHVCFKKNILAAIEPSNHNLVCAAGGISGQLDSSPNPSLLGGQDQSMRPLRKATPPATQANHNLTFYSIKLILRLKLDLLCRLQSSYHKPASLLFTLEFRVLNTVFSRLNAGFPRRSCK